MSSPAPFDCSTSGFFRIGSERYAEENESYGLTTMRRKHVTSSEAMRDFDYPAKRGQSERHQESTTRSSTPVLKALPKAAPAAATSSSRTETAGGGATSSDDINDYIKEVTGGHYSAKDFRTWNATVLAARPRDHDREAKTKTARKRIARRRQGVAPSSATRPRRRASYIDPRVFDRLDAGETIRAVAAAPAAALPGRWPFVEREAIERAVVRLLSD